MVVKSEKIILSNTDRHKTLEERAVELSEKIGPYEEFEWGDSVGREQW